jgi:hypothetical protein
MKGPSIQGGESRQRLTVALVAASGLSLVVVASGLGHDSPLGAPPVWPWLLTGLQVLALWSAGRRYWWGWLVGGSVQLPWIAYAVMTDQIGFIPGCLVSATIQLYSFLHSPRRTMEVMA